jgi:hypothetical protein
MLYWSTAVGDAKLMSVSIQSGAPLTVSAPRVRFGAFAPDTWDVAPDGRFLVETVPDLAAGSVQVTVTNWFEELRRRAPGR